MAFCPEHPKRDNEHPHHFHVRSSPPPPLGKFHLQNYQSIFCTFHVEHCHVHVLSLPVSAAFSPLPLDIVFKCDLKSYSLFQLISAPLFLEKMTTYKITTRVPTGLLITKSKRISPFKSQDQHGNSPHWRPCIS